MAARMRAGEQAREAPAEPDPRSSALGDFSPWRMSGAEWKACLKGALAHAKQDRINVLAGSLAYRWFLSLFPTLIALLGIASLVRISPSVTDKLVHGAATALPSGASGVLTSAIEHAHARTGGALEAIVIAAIVALWSATSSMTVLQSDLDVAHEIALDRKFVPKRLRALVLLAAVVVLGGAASALVVFGPQLGRLIDGSIPVAGVAFVVLWTVVRWVAAVAFVMLLIAFLYWLAPNHETPRWQWLSPGAIVATALWVAASLAFSFYTSSFGSYGKTYGAFAGVAILIFWLYVTGLVLLLGAEINAELERQSAARLGGGQGTGGPSAAGTPTAAA